MNLSQSLSENTGRRKISQLILWEQYNPNDIPEQT